MWEHSLEHKAESWMIVTTWLQHSEKHINLYGMIWKKTTTKQPDLSTNEGINNNVYVYKPHASFACWRTSLPAWDVPKRAGRCLKLLFIIHTTSIIIHLLISTWACISSTQVTTIDWQCQTNFSFRNFKIFRLIKLQQTFF